mgnify:CR=1 FL=1
MNIVLALIWNSHHIHFTNATICNLFWVILSLLESTYREISILPFFPFLYFCPLILYFQYIVYPSGSTSSSWSLPSCIFLKHSVIFMHMTWPYYFNLLFTTSFLIPSILNSSLICVFLILSFLAFLKTVLKYLIPWLQFYYPLFLLLSMNIMTFVIGENRERLSQIQFVQHKLHMKARMLTQNLKQSKNSDQKFL